MRRRRLYQDGFLMEEWDDEAMIYRRFEGGALVQERTYTPEEAEYPEAYQAGLEEQATIRNLRDQLTSGVSSIIAARDAAVQDAVVAAGFQAQANAAEESTETQHATVTAFAPSATYSQAQVVAIRDAIADLLVRVAQIQQALAEIYSYRVAVDNNAVLTDDALLWLARLASGSLGDGE